MNNLVTVNNLLNDYVKAYNSSNYCGATRILKKYLSLPTETIIPLSISHGIDFMQLRFPQDYDSLEPIHWCYNEQIFEFASRSGKKKCARIPHPWLLLDHEEQSMANKEQRSLIISPPLSHNNNLRLLEVLKEQFQTFDFDILLKDKGHFVQESIDFFSSNGIKCVSAGKVDNNFYSRLSKLFSSYHKIISPTLSSAIIFAGYLGKEIQLIENYAYRAVETFRMNEVLMPHSKQLKQLIKLIQKNNTSQLQDYCYKYLGSSYLDTNNILKELNDNISKITNPIFLHKEHSSFEMKFRKFIFKIFKKTSLLSFSFSDLISKLLNYRKRTIIEIDEIDFYMFGKSFKNFKFEHISNSKIIPGQGI